MKLECTVEELIELTNKKIYATLDSSSIAKDLVKKIKLDIDLFFRNDIKIF